ncbi:dynein axonemal intermediate chain 7-like isoform X3 [Vidua chalybeata]|uniref:dynein axonemal intermediate chain 7-like isoform X3 n=1 Tax=Vidua chalybeata TaxID=81927 RepID=UPI0023A8FE0C|nr:dynein axonemal intermediate chain 7-like isoform X3 [Vidua chalybeata]
MSVSLSTRLTLLSGELSRRGGPAAGGAKRQRRGTKSCGVAAAVALGGCVPHFCPAAATPGPGHRGLEHGGGQQWRTDGISKITYEAEEKSITFSMGAFYTVALLQDAHLNLPYQAWELHPAGVDEGLFTVTAVFATIQIQIKDNQCMLSSVVVEEEEMLSHITGKWMSPFALRAALKRAGVNIFPAEYSPKYVPVLRKAALAEVKAYEQMALLAAAFAFAHSKWNGEAGPEQVVFKVREHLTVMKVQNLKLPETSEAFSEEPEFHSTLYHMLKDSASSEAMDKVERAGFLFIDSVYQLLLPTRVLAYS